MKKIKDKKQSTQSFPIKQFIVNGNMYNVFLEHDTYLIKLDGKEVFHSNSFSSYTEWVLKTKKGL